MNGENSNSEDRSHNDNMSRGRGRGGAGLFFQFLIVGMFAFLLGAFLLVYRLYGSFSTELGLYLVALGIVFMFVALFAASGKR